MIRRRQKGCGTRGLYFWTGPELEKGRSASQLYIDPALCVPVGHKKVFKARVIPD